MPKPLNLEGVKFGRLTVIQSVPKRIRSWLCSCDCGNTCVVITNKLTSGHTKSCGCIVLEGCARRHGMKGTRIYSIWKDMRKRCRNPNSTAYHRYGGRGITVCKEWDVFEVFLADMGLPPTPSHTIDRIDNNAGYSPDNCRWATMIEQQRNRRNNRILSHNGKTMCLSEWATILNIKVGTLQQRLVRGWSLDRALLAREGA